MTRALAITNHHPRLRVSRPVMARAINLLDDHFRILPADRRHLSANRKSKTENHQSPVPPGVLSVVFLTDPALAKIHGDFMADPTATDVITFEGNATAGLAGEICVSADTAAKYVGLLEGRAPARPRLAGTRALPQRLGRSPTLQNRFSAELTLYVIHGWLHLAGYDDLQPAKKRRMRAAEARAMKLLREAGAVPEFKLV